jgi:hypothetical protein
VGTRKKKIRRERRVTVRLTELEYERLSVLSDEHARGNRAAFLRRSALEHGWLTYKKKERGS